MCIIQYTPNDDDDDIETNSLLLFFYKWSFCFAFPSKILCLRDTAECNTARERYLDFMELSLTFINDNLQFTIFMKLKKLKLNDEILKIL